jgi:hypothetical protein
MGETVLEGGDPAGAIEPLRNAATLATGWGRADEALAATWLMSDEVAAISEFFSRSERAACTGARAALILGIIASGASRSPASIEPAVQESMRRILGRLAPAVGVDRLSRV